MNEIFIEFIKTLKKHDPGLYPFNYVYRRYLDFRKTIRFSSYLLDEKYELLRFLKQRYHYENYKVGVVFVKNYYEFYVE